MIKHYVFWGGFALVMAGIVITLIGNYRRSLARERAIEAAHARLAGEAWPVPPPAKDEPANLPEARFDAVAGGIGARADASNRRASAIERSGAAVAGNGKPSLLSLGGSEKGHAYSIPAIGLTIGRGDDNDVIIIDGRVSLHHAWIGLVNGKAMLRDYQSLNGTFLNAQMGAPVSEAALLDGDIIVFGGPGGGEYRFVAG